MGNDIRVTREQFLATRAVFAAHRATRRAAQVVASAEVTSAVAPTVATPTLKARVSNVWCRLKASWIHFFTGV
jgi:hypothetical protein